MAGTGELGNAMLRADKRAQALSQVLSLRRTQRVRHLPHQREARGREDGQTRPAIQREAERPSEESVALAVSSAWAVQRGADRAKRVPRDSSLTLGLTEGGRRERAEAQENVRRMSGKRAQALPGMTK